MKLSTTVVIIAAIVIVAGGAWWYTQTNSASPSTQTSTNTGNNNTPDYTPATTTNATSSTSTGVSAGVDVSVGASAAKTVTVTYTSSGGFSPKSVTVNKGDTVTFVASSGSMWVGSDEHPSHSEYDGTTRQQHCSSGTNTSFDQCAVGASYNFTFTKVGTFDYHNHVSSSQGGVVVVK